MKLLSKTVYFLLFSIIILLISVSVTEASQLKIEVAAVGTDVQNRTLLGKGSLFKEGSTIFFFTKVIGGEAGDMINHVWIHEDSIISEIPLTIGSPCWRTWSNKNLFPNSIGTWRVEARNALGEILASSNFVCVSSDLLDTENKPGATNSQDAITAIEATHNPDIINSVETKEKLVLPAEINKKFH